MDYEKIVVGLDIGTTKIAAIVGKKNQHGKLDVLGMGQAVSDGVVRGVVNNIDKTVAAIQKAIREAEEQSGIDINVVNVGIAGQHIRSSMHHHSITRISDDDEIKVEDVNRLTNEIYRIMMPAGSEIIHVMPQDYMVDYEEGILDPVGMAGTKLEANFHVITAKTNDIKNIHKCVKRAGLEVENLILEPLASSLSALSDEEKEAGVCLIDIGGGTTDIAIFHDNIIRHTAVVPFGGDIITSDIKQGCSVMQNQAELLKTKFGRAIAEEASPNEIISIPGLRNRPPKEISIKNLAFIIEARMEEIIEYVHSEIIASGYDDKLAAGLVVTGGGSQLLGIKQLFEYMTGKDVRVGFPNEHLGKSKINIVKSPMYATGVGLVLTGFRSLDEREERYKAYPANREAGNENTSKPNGGDFFKKIINKTKGLLIDDIDNTNY
ncbi:cell division protein FtsA [Mangrovivirga cuniculi]|uniref:Cell division protein FtsA n=1 Tax=Mangrovivirga cuniculi TaxID=2715131 RepID=A0A4D7JG19_9BACT|nr:cell division protein FtsA [Mangrovivirga cuniculi]QCK14561.1 cell division protein FtsA [Mangrovivirga cuniculi]